MRGARDRPLGTRRAPSQVICLRRNRVQSRRSLMNRRNILWSTVSALGAAFAASRAKAAAEAAPSSKLKVVYHLSDADKVNFVLGNIQIHIVGVGGPDHITLALVIHGPALKAFHQAQANPDIRKRVGAFSRDGVGLA